MAEEAKNDGNGGFDISPFQLALLAIFLLALICFVAVESFSKPVREVNKPNQTAAVQSAAKKAVLPTIMPSNEGAWKLDSK